MVGLRKLAIMSAGLPFLPIMPPPQDPASVWLTSWDSETITPKTKPKPNPKKAKNRAKAKAARKQRNRT